MNEENVKEKNDEINSFEKSDNRVIVSDKNQILNIDDILAGDSDVAYKLRNLHNYGVTNSNIKTALSKFGNIDDFDNEEAVLVELEKVFSLFATMISDDHNGIVIDLKTGKVDEELSILKCERLNIVYGEYDTIPLKNKQETFEVIFEKIINEEENKKNDLVKFLKDMDGFKVDFEYYKEWSNEKLDENLEKMGIEKEKINELHDQEEYSTIGTRPDFNVMYAIFRYEELIENSKNLDEEKRKEFFEELQRTISENPDSKYIKDIIGEDGKLSLSKVHNIRMKFQENRNFVDIVNKLTIYEGTDNLNFNDLPKENKEELIKTIARAAFLHSDDPTIAIVLNTVIKKYNIDVSFEEMSSLIKENFNKSFSSEKDLRKFVSNNWEFGLETYGQKFEAIDEALENGYKSEEEAKADNKYAKNYLEVSTKLIYMNMTHEIKKSFIDGQTSGFLDLLTLYMNYNDSEDIREQKIANNILRPYLLINKEYINRYLENNFDDEVNEKGIFNKSGNGQINVGILRDFLKRNEDKNEDRIQSFSDMIKKYTDRSNDSRQKYSEQLNEIQIITRSRSLTKEEEKRVIDLIQEIDVYSLNNDEIEGLMHTNSISVSKAIKEKISEEVKSEGYENWNSSKNLVKIDILDTLESNILLLETKLNRGKNNVNIFDFLKENSNYRSIYSKYRDENGNLTEYGKKEISKFENKLISEVIAANTENVDINKINDEEKDNYQNFLIVGLFTDNLRTQHKCKKKLSELYPEYKDVKDGEKFKSLIFQKLFGLDYKDNSQLVKNKIQLLKNNILDKVLDKKDIIEISSNNDKILDEDFDELFKSQYSEIDATGTDFLRTEIESLFDGSKIEFNKEDEAKFTELYEKTTIGSWMNSKDEAIKQTAICLILMKESLKENSEKSVNESIKHLNNRIDKIFEENPGLKEQILDKSGNLEENIKKENVVFRESISYLQLLNNCKTILKYDKKYEDMDYTEKKLVLKNALIAYSYNKDIKYGGLINKISNRIFEKISSQEKEFIKFDKNGNPSINQELILKEWNNTTKFSKKSFAELVDEVKKNDRLYGILPNVSKYLLLEKDDFSEITGENRREKINNVLFKSEKMRQKIEERKFEISLETFAQRRYKILENEVIELTPKEIEEITDPNILAIWYNNRICTSWKKSENLREKYNREFKQKFGEDSSIENTLENLSNRVRMEVHISRNVKSTVKEEEGKINKLLGNTIFSDIKNKNKEKRINNFLFNSNKIGSLGNKINCLEKEDIDKCNNLNVSTIWYYSAINKHLSLGLKEEADELKKEFFQLNNIKIEDSVRNLKNKVSDKIEVLGNNIYDKDNVKDEIIGHEEMKFININSKLYSNIVKNKEHITIKFIKQGLRNKSIEDKKIILASLYNKFKENENKDYDSFGMNAIKKYILRNENYSEFINQNQEIDVDKLLSYAKFDNRATDNIYNSITKKVEEKTSQDKSKFKNVISYINGEYGLNKSKIQEVYKDLKYLLEENLLSKEAQELINSFDPIMYKNAIQKNQEKKTDTWRILAARGIDLTGKAVKNLPMLLQGKEKRKEYKDKFIRHVLSGMERTGGRLDKMQRVSMGNKAYSKNSKESTLPQYNSPIHEDKNESRVASNGIFSKITNLFKRNRVKALPQGEKKVDNNDTIINEGGDKETNSQHHYTENNVFHRDNRTIGCDTGVADELKNQQNTETHAVKANSEVEQTLD